MPMTIWSTRHTAARQSKPVESSAEMIGGVVQGACAMHGEIQPAQVRP